MSARYPDTPPPIGVRPQVDVQTDGRRFRERRSTAEDASAYLSGPRRQIIGFLKYALPVSALVTTAVLLGWTMLKPTQPAMDVTFIEDPKTHDQALGLEEARFYGLDTDQQPFTITAARATHVESTPDEVELSDLQADITLASGMWVTVSAIEGLYDRPSQLLMLDGGINVFSDRGYEFFTEAMLIDLTAGVATSETPIKGQGPFGVVLADRLRLKDMGRQVFFDGNVKATLYPAAQSRDPETKVVVE